MQAVWPAALAYVLAAHRVHVAAAKLVAPAGPYEPAAQTPSGTPRLAPFKQGLPAPVAVAYVPGAQIVHVAAAAVVDASGPA